MMHYRVLITGSRKWKDEWRLWQILNHFRKGFLDMDDDIIIVHGACPDGADDMADRWAKAHGVIVERYPAKWTDENGRFDKAAGFKRNRQMVDTNPSTCLAFIRNNSPGATHTAKLAESRGIITSRFIEEG